MKMHITILAFSLLVAVKLAAQETTPAVKTATVAAGKPDIAAAIRAKLPLLSDAAKAAQFSDAMKRLSTDPEIAAIAQRIHAAGPPSNSHGRNGRPEVQKLYTELYQKQHEKIVQLHPELKDYAEQVRQFREELAKAHEAIPTPKAK